jgi:hypothetical protein
MHRKTVRVRRSHPQDLDWSKPPPELSDRIECDEAGRRVSFTLERQLAEKGP